MKVQSIITKSIAIIIALILMASPWMANIAAAQTAQPCGPYGVCPPPTDITIGNIVIPDQALIAILGIYGAGFAFLLNGYLVKNKLITR
jgi:hypothetical protein